MSTNNLTYFIGAGASAGTKDKTAIPILNKFNEELNLFFKELLINEFNDKDPHRSYIGIADDVFFSKIEENVKHLKNLVYSNGSSLYSQNFLYFILHVNQLLIELNDHTTVDTLARKYFLLGTNKTQELLNLKAFLSIYFLHLQQNENRFDMRYDSFISTILERDKSGSLTLPNNIKIISWNYDLQFEIALKKYHNSKLKQIQDTFGIHPSMSYHGSTRTMDSFGIAKLNGTAGLFVDLREKSVRDIDEFYPGIIERQELFDLYFGICRSGNFSLDPFYRYSWEKDNPRFDLLPNMKALLHGYAKEIMEQTNHLVVIGYSFPPFNRRLDIELFDALPQNAVVYVQDKNPTIKQNIEDIFRNFEQKNIIVKFIEDVSQFHIPPIYFED